MKKMKRIVALLLAAAICLGFYIPSVAQAAETVESWNWGGGNTSFADNWTVDTNDYWTLGEDGTYSAKADINEVSGERIYCTPSYRWDDFTATAKITSHRQETNDSSEKFDYTTSALEFYAGGSRFLRLYVKGNLAVLWYSGGTNLGSASLTGMDTSKDSQDYTLSVTVQGGKVTASVTYIKKTRIGWNNYKEEETTVTVASNVDLSQYDGLRPGNLRLHFFRSLVPGDSGTETEAVSGKYFAKGDVKSVAVTVNSFTSVNSETSGKAVFTDDFSGHEIGTNPNYWVEDSGVNAFTVAASPSSAAADGCVAPSGNAYKYTGTGYARSWLHAFETNVHYTVKIFVPEGTTSGKVGLITRMSGLDVPGIVKSGYDFSKNVWFVEDGKGDTAIFGDPAYTEAAGVMETGKWNTIRVYVVDRILQLFCNDMSTPVLQLPLEQVTTGRVGLFAEGVTEAYFDDVNFKLYSGQGRVEEAVLANYVVGGGEGGAVYVYDENTLIFNLQQGVLYKSTDNGMTFTKIEKTSAEYATYQHLSQSPRTQYIKLHDGSILKLTYGSLLGNGDRNDYTAFLYSADGSQVTQGGVLYNLIEAGGQPLGAGEGKYAAYYSGGMNEMLKEINLGDIDGDGQDEYRVYHCADVRTTGHEGNQLDWSEAKQTYVENIRYHWQEVYYSDDNGMTWQKADLDTRWLSGLDHICESRIMPVYNADGSLYCVRMFCTWNDGRTVRYFDSFDYGKTWTSERALPELSGGRNSFAYAVDYETGYIYLTYLYGEPTDDDSIYPRNRLVLLRSKDATNWEYLMDVWRWEDVPGDKYDHVNQTVDPSLTINGDYIYVTAGWSEVYKAGTSHNDQRQTLVVLDKSKLTAYEAFPEDYTADKDIVYVEVTAPEKVTYILGEELDLTGGYMTVHYFDGTTEQLPLTDENITLERPDASWLWTSEFDTTDYPLTGKTGKQWIRAEYIQPDRNFNDGIVDGFYIYVGTEEEMTNVLLNGIQASDWDAPAEGQEDVWNFADGKLTVSYTASGSLTGVSRLITPSYKWSGYSVAANITSYAQETGAYAQTALVMGNYQLRFMGLGTTGCTVVLRDMKAGTEVASGKVTFDELTPENSGLTFYVEAEYVGGALTVSVNDVVAFSHDMDAITGNVGFFVFRNGAYEGPVSATLNSLKVTAPTVRKSFVAALEDKISLSIQMGLSGTLTYLEDNVFMKFLLNGKETLAEYSQAQVSGKDITFTAHIAAKEMADTIVAQLYSENGSMLAQHTTTLKDYADYIIQGNYEQRYKDIAQAMLNYGAAAQIHFKHNTENLANGEFADGWNSGIDVSKLAKYSPKYEGNLPTGVTFYGSSLIMEDRTTIRHYFKMDEQTAANVQISMYGQPLQLVKNGSYYVVDITGVDAANLDYMFTVDLTDGENTFRVYYSALGYVYQVLSMDSYKGTSMEQLAQALYLYNRAVDLEPEIGDDEFEILPF